MRLRHRLQDSLELPWHLPWEGLGLFAAAEDVEMRAEVWIIYPL